MVARTTRSKAKTSSKKTKSKVKAKAKNVVAAKAKRNAVAAKPAAKKKAPAKKKIAAKAKRNVIVVERAVEPPHPPAPPADAVEVSGIYERVLYSENDPYAEVREVFNHYDRDRSGIIEAAEFARVLDALGVELQEDELEVGLSIVDADGDGRINWDEFLGWWQSR